MRIYNYIYTYNIIIIKFSRLRSTLRVQVDQDLSINLFVFQDAVVEMVMH